MKLLRFGPPGREKPGILDAEGRIRDLSKVVPDLAGDALFVQSPLELPALQVGHGFRAEPRVSEN